MTIKLKHAMIYMNALEQNLDNKIAIQNGLLLLNNHNHQASTLLWGSVLHKTGLVFLLLAHDTKVSRMLAALCCCWWQLILFLNSSGDEWVACTKKQLCCKNLCSSITRFVTRQVCTLLCPISHCNFIKLAIKWDYYILLFLCNGIFSFWYILLAFL